MLIKKLINFLKETIGEDFIYFLRFLGDPTVIIIFSGLALVIHKKVSKNMEFDTSFILLVLSEYLTAIFITVAIRFLRYSRATHETEEKLIEITEGMKGLILFLEDLTELLLIVGVTGLLADFIM